LPALFCRPPSEPCVQVSKHTALQLMATTRVQVCAHPVPFFLSIATRLFPLSGKRPGPDVRDTNPSPPNCTCMISMHTALRNSRFPRCLTIHPDQQRFQSGHSGTLGFAATMAPPSPCALQRLGDPLVTQETWCVRRPPLRLFPLLVGWFRWEFCTNTGNARRAPDAGIGSFFACGPENCHHELFVEAISLDHIHPS
jgi:hypothetical protein